LNGNASSFAPLAHKGPSSSSSEVEDYQVRKKSWEKIWQKTYFFLGGKISDLEPIL